MSLAKSIYLVAALMGLVSCAQPRSDDLPPLVQAELSLGSEVLIGEEQYLVAPEPKPLAVPEMASQQKDDAASVLSPEQKKPAPKKSPSPPKPSPSIDTDFILKKSPRVQVGLSHSGEASSTATPQNEDRSFVPASIVKILTTSLALEKLSPEFQFSTKVSFDLSAAGEATRLIVSADGDPTVGLPLSEGGAPNHFSDIAKQLKSHGVKKIVGQISLRTADERWEQAAIHQGIPDEDLRYCYGSLATSFNFKRNCEIVSIHAIGGIKWPADILFEKPSVKVETRAGERNSLSLAPILSPNRFLEGFVVSGTYLRETPRTLRVEIPMGNGIGLYARALRSKLLAEGLLNTKTSFETSRDKSDRTHTIEVRSALLSELVVATNKSSDNFFADALLKVTTAKTTSAPLETGGKEIMSAAIGKWLRDEGKSKLESEFKVVEGAGLSTDNRITPRALLALLTQFLKKSYFSILWESLPIAGQDGTLAERMRNSRASGRVRGKTGTLKGSYQVAGYVQKRNTSAPQASSEALVPFVILTETTEKNREFVRRFQDALIVKIVDVVDSKN